MPPFLPEAPCENHDEVHELELENLELQLETEQLELEHEHLEQEREQLESERDQLQLETQHLQLQTEELKQHSEQLELERQQLELQKEQLEYENKQLQLVKEQLLYEKLKLQLRMNQLRSGEAGNLSFYSSAVTEISEKLKNLISLQESGEHDFSDYKREMAEVEKSIASILEPLDKFLNDRISAFENSHAVNFTDLISELKSLRECVLAIKKNVTSS